MTLTPSTETPTVHAERMTALSKIELSDLCDAAEAAIEAGGGFGWLKPPARSVFEAYWRGVLLVPERALFIGRLDGTIAGCVQLVRPGRNNEAQAFAYQIMGSFVAPWARGHGIAKQMTLAAEAAARAAGAEMINLDIRETQEAAIHLYESLGYVRWGEHPSYAKVDGRLIRGLYYYKFIGTDGAGAEEDQVR